MKIIRLLPRSRERERVEALSARPVQTPLARALGYIGVGRMACGLALALMAATLGASDPATLPTQSHESAQAEITALSAQIAHHDELYFKHATPEISDYAYDQLKQRLAMLEQAAGAPVRSGDVTATGDDRTDGFARYRHKERMLSLDKSYSEADLRAFTARLRAQFAGGPLMFVIEPKFDGLAISVTYENGKLVRAVTRGNGEEGDDVTTNLRALSDVPDTLMIGSSAGPVPVSVELRGEVYLPWAEFRRINRERLAEGDEPFADPRNLAAGTLKQRTPDADGKDRRLSLVFYGYGAWEPAAQRPASQQALHAALRAWGLPGVERVTVATTDNAIWAAVQAMGRDRPELPYPIDGAVVKLDDAALQRQAGVGEHAPRWAMAYKFAPQRVKTEVRAITWQVGRTGVLTPVAELVPVQLGGTRVARATLHNRDEITRLDLRIGDTVFVEKAGEIVPAIAGVDLTARKAESRPLIFPRVCPVCGAGLVAVAGEAAIRCPNAQCPAQVRRRLEHFSARGAVAITGLGPAMIEKLVAAGLVKNVADIYRLRREQLLGLPSVGEKLADKLLAAIASSRRSEAWRFVYGLGLPQVGAVTARDLTRRAGSLRALMTLSEAQLREKGVDGALAHDVAMYFEQPENRQLLEVLEL